MSANGDTSKQNSTLEPATLSDADEEKAAGLRPGVEQPVPADVAVTGASDTPAPVGESEVILLPAVYKKGQVLKAASGREYKVIEVSADFIRLRHEAGEENVRREDIPGLLVSGAKGESDVAQEAALDLLDSTDDPLIAALQTQLAEAIADNNRLRTENAELRGLADEQEGRAQDYRALLNEIDDADAALDEVGFPVESKTEIALDIEQRTADAIIERYKAQGWWKEESAFVWRIDPKHPNGGSIAHVIRFEREKAHKAGRSLVRETAVAVGSQPTEPVLVMTVGV